MNNKTRVETVMMYAPLVPCKHHVSSSKIHPYFGQHKESILNKKITIFIKAWITMLLYYLYVAYVLPKLSITSEMEQILSYFLPVFLLGFTVYQIFHLFHKVELFETGMVYITCFSRNGHFYDELDDIQLRYDEQFDIDQRRHGILWFLFAKRFYMYYTITFSTGRGYQLKPKIFRHLKIKLMDLQKNLIKAKIEK